MTEPSSKSEGALDRIVRVAEQQLDLLEDLYRRPQVDVAGLSMVALDMLLRAIADEASHSEDTKIAAFAARHATHLASQIDARQHLIALGDGWVCKHCKNDVVGDVVISDLDEDRPTLQIRCKSCGRVTPIAPLGLAAFKKKFGHLVQPGWDPTRNGFVSKE